MKLIEFEEKATVDLMVDWTKKEYEKKKEYPIPYWLQFGYNPLRPSHTRSADGLYRPPRG